MRWLVIAAIAGCSGKSNAPPPPVVPIDAAVGRPLGPVTESPEPVRDDPRRAPPTIRPSHPIDVILLSTPNGAEAAVDGQPLGPTPAYWNGTADGREHEFTFVLPGHAVARYRFVPITSGVIHARLERVPSDEIDAGVPAPEVPPGIPSIPAAPPVRVDAPAPIPPAPTVLSPDAAVAPAPTGPGPQP